MEMEALARLQAVEPGEFPKTRLNQVKRHPERGAYSKETIYPIVDEALSCHVGFIVEGRPYVIPTGHARDGDTLILHGSTASRMLQHMQSGNELCVAITLLDGLVVARSVFDSSMNYRSVVLFGRGTLIEQEDEKVRALELLTEHLIPGRWKDARKPTPNELKGTAVVAMPIESASAKIRSGFPNDEAEDYALPIWAGILPFQQRVLEPIDDPKLVAGVQAPEYVTGYRR